MKKPKKTLKELKRLEGFLAKQTGRSAKILARRKQGDEENPVTSAYYERIAEQHARSLADLSEIVQLIEGLNRTLAEKEAAKAARRETKGGKASAATAPKKPAEDGAGDAASNKAPVEKVPAKAAAARRGARP